MVALAAADTTVAAAAEHPPLASLTFKLSLAMVRLCHRCAAKCRERCESRGEDLHRRCTTILFFAFVTIAALAAAAAAAAPTTCATRDIVYHWARHR